jgi:hypothetical protein
MKIDDTVYAFPLDTENFAHYGMTLRDYFAGQVILGSMVMSYTKVEIIELSSKAYALADEMLKERNSHEK